MIIYKTEFVKLKSIVIILLTSTQCYFPGTNATNEKVWQLGPFERLDASNPILLSKNDTTFWCPVRNESVFWEIKDVFNPTAIVKDGLVHLLYRAEDDVGSALGTSRIGLATSDDGIHFTRQNTPIFYPENDEHQIYEWDGGCEDPRIVQDDLGTFYMTYTAYDGSLARLFVASSKDLLKWTKHGSVFKKFLDGQLINLWSKSGSIVCTKVGDKFIPKLINGKYWMYFGETDVFLATSTDLINWEPVGVPDENDEFGYKLTPIFSAREGYFDSDIVEPGPQSIVTEAGIVLIYNSRNKGVGGDPELPNRTYSAGQILFDVNNPNIVLDRTEKYFMKPEKDYENVGQVGNVVFLEGLITYKGKWYLYYGTADSKIAVTVANESTENGGTFGKQTSISTSALLLGIIGMTYVVQLF